MSVSANMHLGHTVKVKGNTLTTGIAFLEVKNGRGFDTDYFTIFLPGDESEAMAVLSAIMVAAGRLHDTLANSRSGELS